MTASEIISQVYDNCDPMSYSQIATALAPLTLKPLCDLKLAAEMFGVVPNRPTKAACIAAIQRKIETTKSTRVRCSF